ncbi:MAG: flagellar basal body L-ring protein FlgH [Phycisphaerales bacterium]|jgi:flagellar L-ring protein precursor FlgH|nr:flagellar basal body L-ring protein FlgH [Phycisphaerales bacterium]
MSTHARRTRSSSPAILVLAACAPGALAQSLLMRPAEVMLDERGIPDTTAPLEGTSMFVVTPPDPRTFEEHDLVTILIDETSQSTMEQNLETKKDYAIGGGVDDFPSLRHLLELQFQNGDSQRALELGLDYADDYKGDGKAERKDRVTARITAEVIDVKPNGTLVIEARKTIKENRESKTILLSGTCRQEDVTDNNTVNSSQIASLTLAIETEGDVHKSARKGLIPRALETLFAF